MSKNDDGFNLDDMMEIFGDSAELPAKKESARPAPVHAPAVATAPAPTAVDVDDVSEDELAILAAYEKSKKDQKIKEEEARRKKDDDAQRILEQYEKELREGREREAKLKKQLEERQKKELEDLKKKEAFTVNKEEEERKIIEEFERQAREQKEKDEAGKRAQEEKAQQELQALAAKQKAEEATRQAEAARSEEAFKARAAAQMGDKKESRLMELLAKAQKDLENAAPAPLAPSASSGQALGGIQPAAKGSPKDILIDVEQKENDAFVFMLDETRKSMFTFLAPMIGIKASTNMLNKTVERARAKAPILLKDANWKMDGSLREDGSVDPERILANVQKLPAASRADDFVHGLHELVDLRIKAVEAGLGAKAGADMKHKLADSRRIFTEKGIRPEWINLFYGNVIG